MKRLDGKVVFVTGASSGIGEAVAREAATLGGRVVLLARRVDRLEKVMSAIRESGGEALCAPCDVTDQAQLERAVMEARRAFGGIDVVIANAGFGVQGKVSDLAIGDYDRQFQCNVFGVIRTIHATLPSLRENRGSIGVVGSANGYFNVPGWSAYCMSKHAVRSLCACARAELLPLGVSVTHLAPGFIESDFRRTSNDGTLSSDAKDPVPSWLTMPAALAAKKILAATLHRRREAVITVHAKAVVGLERHAPGLVAGVLGAAGGWVERLSKDAG